MQGVLNEDKYWINSNSNSDDLFKNFPELFDACIGK
jgi:hypothetical protein